MGLEVKMNSLDNNLSDIRQKLNELDVSKATSQVAAEDATKAMEEMTRRFVIKGLDPGETTGTTRATVS